MIRKALEKDLDGVEKGYTDLLLYEQEHGSHSHWVLGAYPTRETAENAFEAGSLYVMEENGAICASMILNERQLDNYKNINWKYTADDHKVKVVHTLCVPPAFARKGCGKQMMEYAEKKAREEGFQVLRIDTCAENEPAKKLYAGLGYRCAGKQDALFMDKIPEEMIFLEKKL